MEENIELFTFKTTAKYESDTEEYHEITKDFKESNKNSTSRVEKTVSEFDFFTKSDVKLLKGETKKKKKGKKKGKAEKASNLMDIINSELASLTSPIENNVITMTNQSRDRYSSYLEKTPLTLKLGRKTKRWTDAEHGWGYKARSTDLNPVFPRVLENILKEDITIPVKYVEPVVFTDLLNEYEETETDLTKFLDVHLNNVVFKYHYKFSLEKVLAVKLCDIYNEYKINQRTITELEKDIKIARDTKNNLKRDLLEVSSKKDEVRFDETIQKYTRELLMLKERYFETIKKHKNLMHMIKSLWSDVELVRDKTECTKTSVILDIEKIEKSTEDSENEWDEIFNVEFNDKLDELEFEFVSKYLAYKEAKKNHKLPTTDRKLLKPKLEIDEETIKTKIESLVGDIALKDQISIRLNYDSTLITDFIDLEKNLNTYFYFKVYVDDVFVCESEQFSTPAEMNIKIDFTERFSVQILPGNEILSIVLVEDRNEIASVKVAIKNIRRENGGIVEFIFKNPIEPNQKAVGNGYSMKKIASKNNMRLKSTNIFKNDLFTTCLVDLKTEWNENFSRSQDESIKTYKEVERTIIRMMHGIDKPNIDVLKDIMSKVYGKDFNNDDKVIKMLIDVCQERIHKNNNFATDESSSDVLRYKLLLLRNNGGIGDVNDQTIPLFASQVSTEQLKCLQKINDNEFNLQAMKNKEDLDPIEVQRFVGFKYVQKLNMNLMTNLNEHLLKKTHKDVVRDFEDLSLRSMFSNKSNLTSLTALSGSTKHKILTQSLSKEQAIQITVHRAFNLHDRQQTILSDDQDDDENIAGFKVRPLRPFVIVSYRGMTEQTATAIGCHPTWNQTIKITAKPDPLDSIHINVFDEHKVNISEGSEDDHSFHSKTVHYRYYSKWLGSVHVPLYSVLSMGMIHGTFKITTPPVLIGYETVIPDKGTPKSFVPQVQQLLKKDSSFLSLKITTSLLHLGGSQGYLQPMSNDEDYLLKHLNLFLTDYTVDFPTRNLSLTFIDSGGNNKCVTQFIQPMPLPDLIFFPKNPKSRSESALSKSSGMSKSSSSKSSLKRKDGESPLKLDERERESVYSTYERWRNAETDLQKLMNLCVRYVALIPTYEVTESHVVTLLGAELLKVLYGSPLDHSLLLASYFLYLGIRAYVVKGQGLPRGLSTYVLTQYDMTSCRMTLTSDDVRRSQGLFSRTNDNVVWYIYDAVSGERFEMRDVGCPLKTVHFVFDNENIWVNVQSSQDCESVSFDFTRSSDWQMVFDKSMFVMKQPVLSGEGLYSAPVGVDRLRQSIEDKVRAKVQKWRSHMKTTWNRYCGGLLREILPHWEYWSFHPTDTKPGLSHKLKQLMVTYKMYGFPLNMAYFNTKSVISAVKATSVHLNDDPTVEFGLAVEVYAYPNNILSVWVFIAAICKI